MSELQLYGKTLPVAMMKSLFGSVRVSVGQASAHALCYAALNQQIEDLKEVRELMMPLFNYCYSQDTSQDLDYRYISLFIDGLGIFYGRKGSIGLEKRIARNWCIGSDFYTLQSRYGGGFEEFLKQLVEQDIVQKYEKQKLAILAMRYLFETFKHDSEIDCEIQIRAKSMIIEIKQCPFCLHKREFCVMFPTLIDCFIDWVQGTYLKTFPIFLQINQEQSGAHRISVDIVE